MNIDTFSKIKCFGFDIDGVLTDGSVILMPGGEQVRVMNIKDGYALQLAVKKGFFVFIISGGRSEEARKRLQLLGIEHIYLGASNKIDVFEEILITHGIKAEEVLYMGDDIPDYEVLNSVGLSACPADAASEIRMMCNYVSPIPGGKGAVRDVIEKTMKAQNVWMETDGFVW
jgi:3-deoxy-D-manno-octulosonate 8-phosphate phosphatase (KDO 8-P phosphatase)